MSLLTGINGDVVAIPDDAIQALKASFKGPILTPYEPGYEDTRKIWNAMVERRPGMILRCTTTVDVVQALSFARQQRLLVSVRGGGHNIAGLAVCDGGVMIDLSLMRGVWVDPLLRTARVQAGCTLGDVDRETQLHGLAAVLGFVSATGVAGLTVGGGFGYLTRRHGWTCDSVTAMEVVTAGAEVLRVSADENADLFWALRGGGGNFGIRCRCPRCR
jgi:FAD/FMN-containing dehydrogenase